MDLILHIIRRQNQLRQKRRLLAHHRVHDTPMVIAFSNIQIPNSLSVSRWHFRRVAAIRMPFFSAHIFGVVVVQYFFFSSKLFDFVYVGTSPLPLTHTTQTTTSVASTPSHTKTINSVHSVHDITSGCSRTIPISWNNSSLLQVCIVCVCLSLSRRLQMVFFTPLFSVFFLSAYIQYELISNFLR